jgi:predicted glycogen debranching enzyme
MGGMRIEFGPELCGNLAESRSREWLVADGLGGFAMGTVAGLRTRRYHGLLIVATRPPIGRMMGLVALDPLVIVGDRRIRLAVHEWAGGAIDPGGHAHLASFSVIDGVPRWRWVIGDVVLEREVAMARGRPVVGVVHRLVRALQPVRLELDALCTWRDVHGERFADGSPAVERIADGFVFENAYRVRGPAPEATGEWYRGVHCSEEQARGLNPNEDLFHAGRFSANLSPGEELPVEAWAGDPAATPPSAGEIVASARARARRVAEASRPNDDTDRLLAHAADQLVVAGPTVVAGYPWFGDWSRDTMTSYEGLLLETRRWDDGRELLHRAADTLSEGMLANTADVGGRPEYNTADGTLWFVHAVGRHVDVTGDLDLAAELAPSLEDVIEHHFAGTRYGIAMDRADGLLTQGADGLSLTWMDARVDGVPVTQRAGKAVEINALWVEALATFAGLMERLGKSATRARAAEARARVTFPKRFAPDGTVRDVVEGPAGDRTQLRPNQLLAVSLPHGPLRDPRVVERCARALLTPIGLRSLSPYDPEYLGRHRGGPAERDRAYHQGTVWPWLIGPFVEAALRTRVAVDAAGDGLEAHLADWGIGSVSETADGDPPHAATGCPFQAWSVAEVLRARRLMAQGRAGHG